MSIDNSKINYGVLAGPAGDLGVISSKVNFGVIFLPDILFLSPDEVPDDSEIYSGVETISVVSPKFVHDSDYLGLPTLIAPFTIRDRERNPYSAHVSDTDLPGFHSEQQRIIRQQHNLLQAGDTTFDYGLLLKSYPSQEFTLGSVGRFYHDDHGLILARYVEFSDMVDTSFQGVPVGRFADTENGVDWKVTNDFSKSGRDLVAGMIFIWDIPADGTFGWMVTHGPNPASCGPGSLGTPLQNDPYSWSDSGLISLGARGRVVARRWGRAFTNGIGPGQIFIALEGLSPADLAFAIEEANAEIIAQIEDIDGRVTTNTTNITALRGDVTGLQTTAASLQAQIDAEETARIRDIASVRDALGSAVDWSSAILTSANLVRAEFAAADEDIRVIAVDAQTKANNAVDILAGFDIAGLTYLVGAVQDNLLSLQDRLVNFTVDVVTTPPTDLQGLIYDLATNTWIPQSVVLAVASTDNAVVRFNGTAGQVQNSDVTILDSGWMGIGTSIPLAPLQIDAPAVNTDAVLLTDGLLSTPSDALSLGGFGALLVLGTVDYTASYQLAYFSESYGKVANYQTPGNGLSFDHYTLADAYTGSFASLPYGGLAVVDSAFVTWGGLYSRGGGKFSIGQVDDSFVLASNPTPIITFDTANNNAGMGTTSPNASAILDLVSTTKAFMPPRMTTAQKNAISSPTAGMVVYDTNLAALCLYNGSSWTVLSNNTHSGALVRNSAGVTGINASAGDTLITWNSETYDTNSFHDNSTNPSRLTIPSGVSYARLSFQIEIDNVTAGVDCFVNLYKNGSILTVGGAQISDDAVNATTRMTGSSAIIAVTAGDYFELKFFTPADSSTDLNVTSWFQIEVIE